MADKDDGVIFDQMDDADFAKEFLPDLNIDNLDGEAEAEEEVVTEPDTPEGDEPEDEASEDEDAGEEEDDEPDANADGDAKEAPVEGTLPAHVKVLDGDGDQVDVAGVKVQIKVGGKQREVDFAKLVRFAESGGYNEQLQAEVQETRTKLPELEAELNELRGLADQRAGVLRKLLEDDDYLLEQREKYLARNTPEARAERAEGETARLRAERQQERVEAQVASFVDTQLYPAFDQLVKQYPSISEEELWGRFTMAAAPLTQRGVIPPQQWDRALDLVHRDLAPWAQQQHEKRAGVQKQVTQKAEKDVTQAKEQATRAKRNLAKRIRPAGTGTSNQASKRKEIVSAEDAVDDIIDNDIANLVRSMRG